MLLYIAIGSCAPAVRPLASSPRGAVLIVDKPHGSRLDDFARASLAESGGAFCHNLDRVTSGCMVAATDEAAASAVGRLWREGRVAKVYAALVEGWCDDAWRDEATLDFRIETSKRRSTQKVKASGKRAETRVRLAARGALRDGRPVSLVWCAPVTGRRHQLRVHLAHVGHPIVSDGKYGAASAPLDCLGPSLDGEAPRVFLHAASVALPLPAELGGLLSAVARLDGTRWHAPGALRLHSALAAPPGSWFAECCRAADGAPQPAAADALAANVGAGAFDSSLFTISSS